MTRLETQYITAGNTYLGIINGNASTTLDDFYKEIKTALQFPNYFGNNLDALDECLNDLSGIEEEDIVLLIINYVSFLSEEESKKQIVADIIANAEAENKSFSVYYID